MAARLTVGDALGEGWCFRESWRVTRGNVWSLIGLYLVLGLISFGCVILLFLPVIFLAMPLILGVVGAVYRTLVGFESDLEQVFE